MPAAERGRGVGFGGEDLTQPPSNFSKFLVWHKSLSPNPAQPRSSMIDLQALRLQTANVFS